MSSSVTASNKLISSSKATAESIGSKSKGDVDFTELNASFTEYSEQVQASIDALVAVSDEGLDPMTMQVYTDALAAIKTSIDDLETDSKAGRMKRLTYKTPMTRNSKEDRFSQKVTSLEGSRVSMDSTTLISRKTNRLAARLESAE
jgi:hypothetical protein